MRGVLEDSSNSEGATGSGALEPGGGRVPDAGGSVIIVLEVPDTNVIGTLVLPGIDHKLYEWEGRGRGLSTRGR